jgi:hypothetical protein
MGLKSRPKAAGTELKTKPTTQSPHAFIAALADERRRAECTTLLGLMSEVSGAEPRMWGSSIIGFGSYDYKYPSGREGTWPRTGFSPRKQSLTIYCMPGFARQAALLKRLGPHKTAVSCLYIKRLDQVNLEVLRKLVAQSLEHMAARYPE